MFRNKRYVTKEIAGDVPVPIQILLWNLIDTMDVSQAERDTEYIESLISAAAGMGIAREEIEYLLECGLTYEEIENYLYLREEV